MAVNIRRIAKNSIYLYIRMVVTMVITIFSSRVVLQSLGVEGFGTYNIIYGIVTLFLFIQSSLNTSSLRFISSSLTVSTREEQVKIFNTSFQVTSILSLLVLLLLETVGLYIVNNVIDICEEYRGISNLCYQVCIVSYVFQMIRIPYNSLIISYERMSFYSVISIVESVCKLLAAYLLFFSADSKLISYCVYVSLSTAICTIITIIYSRANFSICRVSLRKIELDRLKQIFSFSSWTTLSSFSNSVAQQGGNILMNVYSGVVANAAWGIAHQVNTAFAALASSLQTAFNPQINKSYAEKDILGLSSLISRSSSIAYYLVLLIGIPIICNIEYVLDIWLVTPPKFAAGFCVCIIIFQMIDTMQAPFNILIFASGKVKFYNIWLSSILFLNIIISAILLSNGFSPICVPLTMVVLNALTGILRFVHIKRYINISLNMFIANYLSRMILVTILSFIVSLLIVKSLSSCLLGVGMSIISTLVVIMLFGFSRLDKQKILHTIKTKYKEKFLC